MEITKDTGNYRVIKCITGQEAAAAFAGWLADGCRGAVRFYGPFAGAPWIWERAFTAVPAVSGSRILVIVRYVPDDGGDIMLGRTDVSETALYMPGTKELCPVQPGMRGFVSDSEAEFADAGITVPDSAGIYTEMAEAEFAAWKAGQSGAATLLEEKTAEEDALSEYREGGMKETPPESLYSAGLRRPEWVSPYRLLLQPEEEARRSVAEFVSLHGNKFMRDLRIRELARQKYAGIAAHPENHFTDTAARSILSACRKACAADCVSSVSLTVAGYAGRECTVTCQESLLSSGSTFLTSCDITAGDTENLYPTGAAENGHICTLCVSEVKCAGKTVWNRAMFAAEHPECAEAAKNCGKHSEYFAGCTDPAHRTGTVYAALSAWKTAYGAGTDV